MADGRAQHAESKCHTALMRREDLEQEDRGESLHRAHDQTLHEAKPDQHPQIGCQAASGRCNHKAHHAEYKHIAIPPRPPEPTQNRHNQGAEDRLRQRHVPGAHHLEFFYEGFDFNEVRLSQQVDKVQEVVFYHHGEAEEAAHACAFAVTWGFEKVYCFTDGLRAWVAAGYPVETGN